MPPVHKRTFQFLVTFMKELLEHSEVNGLDPKVLGKIVTNRAFIPDGVLLLLLHVILLNCNPLISLLPFVFEG